MSDGTFFLPLISGFPRIENGYLLSGFIIHLGNPSSGLSMKHAVLSMVSTHCGLLLVISRLSPMDISCVRYRMVRCQIPGYTTGIEMECQKGWNTFFSIISPDRTVRMTNDIFVNWKKGRNISISQKRIDATALIFFRINTTN